jgi:hypothetical protein
MKAQERSATPPAQEDAPARAATGEWDGKVVSMGDDFVELDDNTERAELPADSNAPVENGTPARATGDAHLPRERRATVVSTIPAELAKSMGQIRDPAGTQAVRPWSEVRDPVLPATPVLPPAPVLPLPSGRSDVRPIPGTPAPMHQQVTRPVDADALAALNAGPEELTDTYNVELFDDSSVPINEQVRSLIESARTYMESGNLGAAVIAADQALAEAGKTTETEVADMVKAARPLFDRIFAAYVGLLTQVPVRARTDEQIAGQELGDRTHHLLKAIDGEHTLEQIAADTGIPPVEAMKIAASLLAAGIVRVQ